MKFNSRNIMSFFNIVFSDLRDYMCRVKEIKTCNWKRILQEDTFNSFVSEGNRKTMAINFSAEWIWMTR